MRSGVILFCVLLGLSQRSRATSSLQEDVCIESVCDTIPPFDNINHTASTSCVGTESRDSCPFVCNRGWTATGSARCLKGEWIENEVLCFEDPCSNEPPVLNLSSTYSCLNTPSRHNCSFVCSQGYTASGPATCILGEWNTNGHSCLENSCDISEPSIEHLVSSCVGTISRANCTYDCNTGYSPSSTVRCLRGEWLLDGVSCDPDPCDSVPPYNYLNHEESDDCVGTQSGDTCELTCLQGYEPTEPAQCLLGQWTDDASCIEIDECERYQPCQNGGTCTDRVNAYVCTCTHDYHGENCTYHHNDCPDPLQSDDYQTELFDLCGHATCVNLARQEFEVEHFRCDCNDGWSHEIGDLACRKENKCLPWDFPPGVESENCNSSVILTSIHRPTCDLSCGTGYRAANINLSNVLSCGLDGGLADTEFQCDPLPCDVEPNILFADLTIESCVGTQSFETCAFYCEPGFHPSGEISCSLGNWNMDAHCVPDDCSGSPTKIDNMDQFMCTGTVPSGTACEYTCLPGYIRSSDVVVCSEGRWQDRRVTCDPMHCIGVESSVSNINEILCSGPGLNDESCDFDCMDGYRKSGTDMIHCQLGQWETTSQCVPKSCAENVEIEHMSELLTCQNTAHGHTCDILCADGYVVSSPGYATCIRGSWNLSLCEPMDCSGEPFVAHMSSASTSCSGTRHGESCRFNCSQGYRATEAAQCEHGTYLPGPLCVPMDCENPPTIAHGDASACIGTSHGSSCNISCYSGFQASGPLSCLYGNFNTQFCAPLSCSENLEIVNAASVQCQNTQSGGSCIVQCRDGFTVSGPAECTQGIWSTIPQCLPNPCVTPFHTNNIASTCENVESDGRCDFTCVHGFSPTGSAICLESVWDDSETCEPDDCTGDPNIDYILMGTCGESTPSETACAFECDTGFTPSGVAICIAGAWQYGPECTAERCFNSDLSQVAHLSTSETSCDGTISGKSCPYVCEAGYEPSHYEGALCNLGSFENVSCVEINECSSSPCLNGATCTDLLDAYECTCSPNYFGVHCAETHDDCASANVTELCTVNGDCVDRPRVTDGDAHYTCDCHSGWTGTSCTQKVTCEPFSFESGMVGDPRSTKPCYDGISLNAADNHACYLSCNEGYVKSTSSNQVFCDMSGNLHVSFNCTEATCLGAPSIQHAVSSSSCALTPSGSSCSISCFDGYESVGDPVCHLGNWDLTNASCVPLSCDSLLVPHSDYASNPLEGVVDTTIRVECDPGFVGGGMALCDYDRVFHVDECVAVSCYDSRIAKSTQFNEHLSLTGVTGDTLTYDCETGYSSSSNVATCNSDRTWDFSPCEPLPCEAKTIENSNAIQVQGVVGGVVQVHCNEGFFGGGSIVCIASDRKFTDVTCSASSCEFITVPGSLLYSTYENELNGTTGTEIELECQAGYIGGGVATCLTNHTWSYTPCEAQECEPLIVNHSIGTTYTGLTNDVVEVECEQGYEGGGVSTCDGSSFSSVPSCVAASCPTMNVSNSEHILYDGVYGDEITIECNPGYRPYQPNVKCGAYLYWNHNPRCDPEPCEIVIIENSVDDMILGVTGESVDVQCLPGYVGGGVATCQGDTLTFTSVSPCEPQACAPDTIPHSVSYSSSNSLEGMTDDVFEIVCEQGWGPGGTTTCSGETLTFTPHISCDQNNACGELTVANSNTSRYQNGLFGDVVYVQCDDGFSGSHQVTCTNTHEWSQVSTCVPETCEVVTSAKPCNAMTVVDCIWDYRGQACHLKPCNTLKTRSKCVTRNECIWGFGRCMEDAGCESSNGRSDCESNNRCRWLSGSRCVTIPSSLYG